MRSEMRVPLPKGWPRSVRSAVIHAISLAQFSLTRRATRSRCQLFRWPKASPDREAAARRVGAAASLDDPNNGGWSVSVRHAGAFDVFEGRDRGACGASSVDFQCRVTTMHR